MTTAIEETLVLIKPDGVARNLTGEILRRKVVGSPRKLDALKEHLAARYGRVL